MSPQKGWIGPELEASCAAAGTVMSAIAQAAPETLVRSLDIDMKFPEA
jgi:hypothetical protein